MFGRVSKKVWSLFVARAVLILRVKFEKRSWLSLCADAKHKGTCSGLVWRTRSSICKAPLAMMRFCFGTCSFRWSGICFLCQQYMQSLVGGYKVRGD